MKEKTLHKISKVLSLLTTLSAEVCLSPERSPTMTVYIDSFSIVEEFQNIIENACDSNSTLVISLELQRVVKHSILGFNHFLPFNPLRYVLVKSVLPDV